jgi:hypothetical protein
MNELETALKAHDWTLDGYKSRINIDKLMKKYPDQSKALWEQYCPWSVANGGYIAWAKKCKSPTLV